MARVSRTTAAMHRHSAGNSDSVAVDASPSLNSLRSLQEAEEEQKRSFKELIMAGMKIVYNFTIGSCFCAQWCKHPYFDILDNKTASEDEQILLMREILSLHFMNPFQKWKYSSSRRFPWKLVVQIVSIILATIQLVLFANSKFAFTNFIHQNQATFSNLFIAHPHQADGDDTLPVPITTLYTHEQFQEQVNHTINQFFALDSTALGSYGYRRVEPNTAEELPQLLVTIQKYAESKIDLSHGIYSVTLQNIKEENIIVNSANRETLNWTSILSELHCTLSFMMTFELTTVFLESRSKTPQCAEFVIKVEIQNELSSGNMPVVIHADPDMKACNQEFNPSSENLTFVGQAITFLSNSGTTALDTIVIVFGIFSLVLCFRSFYYSLKLSKIVKIFFHTKFGYRLKFRQVLPLYNMWFIGVIISNILVLSKTSSLALVDYTSIMIGLAVFGQWSGLLRFLSYLDKYNMLLLTLRLSFPSVMRFIICTAILYMAFLLCGWLVLGPYHPKFRDPFVTSECLFSLVNGDDMYTTYKGMSKVSTPAYVFGKVYLYIFIGLFIYVVLSVFISLISDTYETLNVHWYRRSKGLLVDFASGKLTDTSDPQDVITTGNSREVSVHPELLLDKDEEEDYEFIREAASKYTGSSTTVLNGGLEMLCPSNEGSTVRNSSHNDVRLLDHVQVHSNNNQGDFPQFQLKVTCHNPTVSESLN